MTARDFPQWDVLPFDDVRVADLSRFKLVILPSVLVITADQLSALEAYVKQGGKLLMTGETGIFDGPQKLLQPHRQSLVATLADRYPKQVVRTSEKPGLQQHLDPARSTTAKNWRQKAIRENPVLTVTRAPEHLTVQLNESKLRPGEFTLDIVNHHHDLASDMLTPVTAQDFAIPLTLPGLKAAPQVETIRYDETAPHNTRREPLPAANLTFAEGTLILRIPPFSHYQILRITGPTS